jgi:hypothetical protein
MSKDDATDSKSGPVTLTDDDIKATPTVGRRSMLRAIGGIAAGTAVGAILGALIPRPVEAQATDQDPTDRRGRGSDPAGHGRHCSDSDSTDQAGHGDNCSDSDQRH